MLVSARNLGAIAVAGGTVAGVVRRHRLSFTLNLENGVAETAAPPFLIPGTDFTFLALIAAEIHSIHDSRWSPSRGDYNGAVVTFVSEVKRPLVNFTTAGGFSTLVALPFLTKSRWIRTNERDSRQSMPTTHCPRASERFS